MKRWMKKHGKNLPDERARDGADIIFFWVARMIIAGLEFKPGKIRPC